MHKSILRLCLLSCCLLGAAPPLQTSGGIVATDHKLASEAGAEILRSGGNAVDAAIAAALACGVVQPASSGLGGGGFAVIVQPDGAAHILDFREQAPASATGDMYTRAEASDASRVGGLAVAVPGEAAGLVALQKQWGTLPLTQLAQPAIQLARSGFEVGDHLESALAQKEDALRCAVLDDCAESGLVTRLALANTIDQFAKSEGEWLRSGAGAQEMIQAANASGGLLALDDLLQYKTKAREPITGEYRGWRITTMSPPSSGGVVLLQALKALERHDLSTMGHNSVALIHLYAETLQHGFADRARFMGDPDRIDVPIKDLLSVPRIQAIGKAYDPKRTLERSAYGQSMDIGKDAGTQHISVIDGNGMSVALTTTINTSFGSQVVTSGGIILNNEMDDFVARPGEPNAYGLIGNESNAVHPGARPLSSMSPTVLVSPDGKTRIVVGASGGPMIITSTLQVIVNVIDFSMNASEAVSSPRIHHQWVPESLYVEPGIDSATTTTLAQMGHILTVRPAYSSVQLVIDRNGKMEGASDPRKGGWPAGVTPQ